MWKGLARAMRPPPFTARDVFWSLCVFCACVRNRKTKRKEVMNNKQTRIRCRFRCCFLVFSLLVASFALCSTTIVCALYVSLVPRASFLPRWCTQHDDIHTVLLPLLLRFSCIAPLNLSLSLRLLLLCPPRSLLPACYCPALPSSRYLRHAAARVPRQI